MNATAVMCGVNQYSDVGASVCSNCSGGQVSSPGSSSCVAQTPTPMTSSSPSMSISATQSRSTRPSISLSRTVSASPTVSAYGYQISLCPSDWTYYYDIAGIEGHDSCVMQTAGSPTVNWTRALTACRYAKRIVYHPGIGIGNAARVRL